MIRLMLATYSHEERAKLAELLEDTRTALARNKPTYCEAADCRTCEYRHLCADLMAAAVFASDYKEQHK